MTMAQFFPTYVWVFDLSDADRERVNAAIMARVDELASPRPKATNDLSLQTDHDFHEEPAFQELQPFLDAAASKVLDFLDVEHAGFHVTGAWVNISAARLRHHEHTHPNNYLSAVYYIATPEGGDVINFHDPRAQAVVITPKLKKITPVNGSVVNLGVKSGRLIIFPSWVRHSVDPNAGSQERISLAINLMLDNFVETMSRPQWKPKIKK